MCTLTQRKFSHSVPGLLAVLTLLAGGMGCNETAPPVTELTSAHASLASGELLRLGALGIEFVTALHKTEPAGLCPVISHDGDQTVLDYGGGCTPDSGSTEEGISGQIYFTIAPSSGWFVGSFQGVGYSSHAVSGQLSGNHTQDGDVARFDVQFEAVERMDRDDLSFAALFEVEANNDSFVVNVDGGVMTGPAGPDTDILLSGVTVQNGSLDACVLPTAGSIELRRGSQLGVINFTEDTASSGLIPLSISGDESPLIHLCS